MTVGDVASQTRGSGARFNAGKPALSLIPLSALTDCARVFDYGRNKYAAWNWAKGMEWSIPYECALRHLSAWFDGEDNDPESGLPHLGHVMCNLVMLSTFARTYRDGDNRPTRWMTTPADKALNMVSMDPPAVVIAHSDGHTADGAGIIPHDVAAAILRDRALLDDEGAPGEPPRCKTGGCD